MNLKRPDPVAAPPKRLVPGATFVGLPKSAPPVGGLPKSPAAPFAAGAPLPKREPLAGAPPPKSDVVLISSGFFSGSDFCPPKKRPNF